MAGDEIRINDALQIPREELAFEASRSGGPGGQNVNKVNTRIMLRFDVASSPALSDWQRARIRSRLATRITKDGVLVVVSQRHRTQRANRQATVERFAELLCEALKRKRVRKKTKPSRGSVERRLDSKKRHSRRKQARSKQISWDE